MTLLDLAHVTVVRGKRTVVCDVSVRVDEGACVALMGHNGSGKTSLLRALVGLLPVAGGEVSWQGQEVAWGSSALRRELGVVFQEYSHDAKLTVRENLLLGARLFHVTGRAANEALDELAATLELTALLSRRCEHLSGGQRRRVELARALMHRPRLLVLDEPSAGLDPAARQAFAELLARRQQAGLSVLMTTHDGEEAARADFVTLLGAGRVLAADTPQALLARCPEDVIVIESDTPQALVAPLEQLLHQAGSAAGAGATAVTAGGVEVRIAQGHTWVPQVVEALHGHKLRAIHLRRASLADVMVRAERLRAQTTHGAA